MRKMVILLGLLLVIGMVLPVMAVKPDPVPPVDPFTAIWDAIENLQAQIDLINSGTSHVVMVKDRVDHATEITPPSGYTIEQCDLIPHPVGVYTSMWMGSPPEVYTMINHVTDRAVTTDKWTVISYTSYEAADGDPVGAEYVYRPVDITIICQK